MRKIHPLNMVMIAILLILAWAAAVFFAGWRMERALAPVAAVSGASFARQGWVRYRDPFWSTKGWWSKHPLITYLVEGYYIPLPGLSREVANSMAAGILVSLGLALIAGGVALFV